MLQEQGVGYRQVLYTPIVVIWAWVSQVLDADKSLSNAVKRVLAWIAAAGEAVPSGDTGAYSKARKRLPLAVLKPLLQRTAAALTAEVKPAQRSLWATVVLAYDATSILMSDTPANQAVYPQHSNSISGLWLPEGIAGGVVLWDNGSRPGRGNSGV